jgi:hypothetical protein
VKPVGRENLKEHPLQTLFKRGKCKLVVIPAFVGIKIFSHDYQELLVKFEFKI